MNFLPITELAIVDIADVGVPGRERVAIRPTQPVDLGQFFFVLGFQNAPNATTPFRNAGLWLGNYSVEPPAWILVFTGQPSNVNAPQPMDFVDQQIHQRVLVYHLGLPSTMFNFPGIMPVILRMTGVLLGRAPMTPPHLVLPANADRSKG